jgi:hypothetical protein
MNYEEHLAPNFVAARRNRRVYGNASSALLIDLIVRQ